MPLLSRSRPVRSSAEFALLELDLKTSGDGFEICACISFRQSGSGTGEGVRIDLTRSPLSLVSVDARGLDVALIPKGTWFRPALVEARLRPDSDWSNAQLVLHLNWTGIPQILSIPEHFPAVIPSSLPLDGAELQRSQIHVSGPALHSEIAIAGLSSAGTAGVKNGGPMLQAILVVGGRIAGQEDCDVVLSPASSGTSRPDLAEELAFRTSVLLGRLGDVFRLSPNVRIAYGTGAEYGGRREFPTGAAQLSTAFQAPDLRLMATLGSIWWGGGCKILGKYGRDLEAGIAFGAALLCSENGSDPVFARKLVAHTERTLPVRLRDAAAGAFGNIRSGLAVELGAAILLACSGNPGRVEVLQRFTRSAWGQYVSVERVLHTLASAGIRLPGFLTRGE